ncbi:unnamed protein product [Polarella glacialis]|uniref:Uncharacterized protein n=1 Tax=Polarella glacialis TaxID=89957 RepID=A0A813I9G9_POLGL|nr:unnamed protein product [Polarella glacialis]
MYALQGPMAACGYVVPHFPASSGLQSSPASVLLRLRGTQAFRLRPPAWLSRSAGPRGAAAGLLREPPADVADPQRWLLVAAVLGGYVSGLLVKSSASWRMRAAMLACCTHTPVATAASSSSELALAVLAGLLSSSCCILQLGLNVFSLGCAGFAALDCLRRPARALTVAGLSFRIATGGLRWALSPRGAIVWLTALVLTFSPELLKYWNCAPGLLRKRKVRRWFRKSKG